jgi:hypothetical protein
MKACGGRCVDPRTSVTNCGLCGRVCATDQVCKDGKCRRMECEDESVLCGLACIFTKSDDVNCGGCGKVCLFGKHCDDGKCK